MTSTPELTTPESNPEKPKKRKGNYKQLIDINKAIRQRIDKGMTMQEIADNQGVSKQAVSSLLQRVTDNKLLTAYKSKRADVYSHLEQSIYETIDMDTIKDSSLLQRVTAAGILKTHYNLETGRATDIQGYDPRSIAQGIAELRGMIQAQPVHNSQSVIEADCYKTLEHGSDE